MYVYMYIYTQRQKLLVQKVISKFQTTLPHIHPQKNLQDTQSHTQKKITVGEIQNHTNALTSTHKDKNISNI